LSQRCQNGNNPVTLARKFSDVQARDDAFCTGLLPPNARIPPGARRFWTTRVVRERA
jgi:hypothetical protein